jgi:hypothetical protein
LGNLLLAAHRVDRNQAVFDFEHFQQFRDRRDFIAFFIHDDLSETDVIGRRPGADHMDRRFAARFVETPTQCFAVDRDELTGGDFMKRRDPTEQTRLEFRRLDRGKYCSIMTAPC